MEKEKEYAAYSWMFKGAASPNGVGKIDYFEGDTCYLKYHEDQNYPAAPWNREDLKEFNSILGAAGYVIQQRKDERPFNVVRELSINFSSEKKKLKEFLKAFDRKK